MVKVTVLPSVAPKVAGVAASISSTSTTSTSKTNAASSSRPSHHVGSPPTSFINPFPSFQTSQTIGLSTVLKMRFSHDRPAFVPVPADRVGLPRVLTPTFGGDSPDFKVTWIGHASFLLETSRLHAHASRGIRILCDPVFSERTSPVSFFGPKRYSPVPCTVDELPDVDVVLISHSHYDHCDLHTLTALYARRKTAIHFIAGLNNAAWFHSIGIPAAQVTDLDWWDVRRIQVEGLGSIKVTCTPTQHTSARTPFDKNHTLWCSYVIQEEEEYHQEGSSESNSNTQSSDASTTTKPTTTKPPHDLKTIFFAGDTGYRSVPPTTPPQPCSLTALPPDLPVVPTFAQIPSVIFPSSSSSSSSSSSTSSSKRISLSLLPIGLCTPRAFMSPVHADPWDSMCIHRDLGSRRSVGMHWGTVRGGLSSQYEDVRDPPRWWEEAARERGLKFRGLKGSKENMVKEEMVADKVGEVHRGAGGDDDDDDGDDDDWEIGLMDIGETIILH